MKALVIEDDRTIRAFVSQGLKEEGYTVAAEADGKAGLAAAIDGGFDVIILDIMLPKMDGIAVCRALRDGKVDAPVIMLTAKGTVDDRVEGLDAGADDYLVKPFAFSELLARIRALARRRKGEGQAVLEHAGLRVDHSRHRASYRGKDIELTRREITLLEHFIRQPGQVLSRTLIIESVWGYDFQAGTNVIDVYVNFLRRKLKELTGAEWIHTVRNRGYVFKAPGE